MTDNELIYDEHGREIIRQWFLSKRAATWGRAFDLTKNMEKAIDFLASEMLDLTHFVEADAERERMRKRCDVEQSPAYAAFSCGYDGNGSCTMDGIAAGCALKCDRVSSTDVGVSSMHYTTGEWPEDNGWT